LPPPLERVVERAFPFPLVLHVPSGVEVPIPTDGARGPLQPRLKKNAFSLGMLWTKTQGPHRRGGGPDGVAAIRRMDSRL
jgi:hypothetical protein